MSANQTPEQRFAERLGYSSELPERCCANCYWSEDDGWEVRCCNPHRVFVFEDLVDAFCDQMFAEIQIVDALDNAISDDDITVRPYASCARFLPAENNIHPFAAIHDSISDEDIAAWNEELAIARATAIECSGAIT